MKLGFAFVLMAVLQLTACKTVDNSSAEQSDYGPSQTQVVRQPQAVFDVWKTYVREETEGKQIQPGCVPTHFAPKEGVSSKGLVVIYHGFTACPQQFFLIGQKLAEKGFDVFLTTSKKASPFSTET